MTSKSKISNYTEESHNPTLGQFFNNNLSLDYSSPENKSLNPENLVISGSGAAGIIYAGVLKGLEEQNKLKNIKRFAGSSGGSIAAMLISIGYTSDELAKELTNKNLVDLLDCPNANIVRLMTGDNFYRAHRVPYLMYDLVNYFGLCKGKDIKKWFEYLLSKKGIYKGITFKQLYEKTHKEIYILDCNLSTKMFEIKSFKHSPNLRVVDCVRTSMGIPGVFRPTKINGDVLVDSGTIFNYPVSIFDKELGGPGGETLGVITSTKEEIIYPPAAEISNVIQYFTQLINTFRNATYCLLFKDQRNIDRTVFLDTLGIGMMDFNMSDKQKQALIQSGKKAINDYFKKEIDNK